MTHISWVGSQEHFVDMINVTCLDQDVVLGRFGGNSSEGQYKNEDGCLIWINKEDNWEFVGLLDAHNTAESAELVLKAIEDKKAVIFDSLKMEVAKAFDEVNEHLLSTFRSQSFKTACQEIHGETACLFVIRKGDFIWWLSIGDCLLLIHHPELAALGEYQQNHRSFYEWVGQKSTFNKTVPCYSSGRKELRKGENHLFLTTDGLLECPNSNFYDPKEIFLVFENRTNDEGVHELLDSIKNRHVRDSTTIISWKVHSTQDPTEPSDNV